MAEHTKLPWLAKDQQIRDTSEHGVSIAYCGTVAGAGVCRDGEIRSFGIDDDTARANAAFIVKAVNNHEALVKALEFYADGRRYEGPNTHPIASDPYAPDDLAYRYDTTRDLGRVARAALAAAKGEG